MRLTHCVSFIAYMLFFHINMNEHGCYVLIWSLCFVHWMMFSTCLTVCFVIHVKTVNTSLYVVLLLISTQTLPREMDYEIHILCILVHNLLILVHNLQILDFDDWTLNLLWLWWVPACLDPMNDYILPWHSWEDGFVLNIYVQFMFSSA